MTNKEFANMVINPYENDNEKCHINGCKMFYNRGDNMTFVGCNLDGTFSFDNEACKIVGLRGKICKSLTE